MFNLFILLAERLGIIMVLAFLLVNMRFFRNLIEKRTLKSQIWLTIIFSLFVVIANLTGVEITNSSEVIMPPIITGLPQSDSIANTRVLVITAASLTGGPYVGAIVGLIGGIHRVVFGNFSDYFYIASSILIGYLVGVSGDKVKGDKLYPSTFWVAVLAFFAELIQMTFIFVFNGIGLVRLIFFPMVLLNTVGASLFIEILKTYLSNERQLKAVQTKDVLELTDKTLPYFRSGLDFASAEHVCCIIKKYTNFDAVGLTDRVNVLAHVGAGEDHHIAGEPVLTDLSKSVITSGKEKIAYSKEDIGCPHKNCPLAAAIVCPLQVNDETIGALKLYFCEPSKLTVVEENLVRGLAMIFSGQLAIGIAEEQTSLRNEAEIRALQVQINPHFFFNAINTIAALMRFDVEKARQALLQLSAFFRSSLRNGQEKEVTFKQEKEHVDAYLAIETLRFPNKFKINYQINVPDDTLLPSFCLQIFIENAIRHAFKGRKTGNVVIVKAEMVSAHHFEIAVTDNGSGIVPAILQKLGKKPITESKGSGTALYNLNRRLKGLYGTSSQLRIETGKTGTTFRTKLPLRSAQERNS
ncbi:LytS/YhcK type 5TM receptor domain-containing protein [Lactobacillus sp. ESL0791]|uniref:LytS/YhcK type 5TM receptor domain-containing protein n=1 Tax=Lactobacillus sp. ESL0791 TaxID=2983234 RepID=UPI0023FA2BA4|nr:LytS/YhcK type 5TM receptor domain-containing protein [Lactobacillus sp. ESL0791]MDF7638217.1 LytS/YhcK type 5TM receptor domain-containing protein [Lactobacillus sp. ESL0791]